MERLEERSTLRLMERLEERSTLRLAERLVERSTLRLAEWLVERLAERSVTRLLLLAERSVMRESRPVERLECTLWPERSDRLARLLRSTMRERP